MSARAGSVAGATFDETRTYRYTLWRSWASGGTVCWVMLNPSTADENVLDPTLRRCKDYSDRWGFGRMTVANLYALRSTDPKALWRHDDPVGPGNDEAILNLARSADLVMVGWGTNAKPERAEAVLGLIREAGKEPRCLKITSRGFPNHPLYLPKKLAPIPFERIVHE